MWKKKVVDTWFHIHMAGVSIWRYVVLVVEIEQPTPKQKWRNVAIPKSNVSLKRTCGVP
ncbi:MAG: hypothetical protein M1540_05860 [Candidatus Bathyarchaeota archaeon]|nr:hypothetical protein [Candidatus Bathyarchaeota archaeon]